MTRVEGMTGGERRTGSRMLMKGGEDEEDAEDTVIKEKTREVIANGEEVQPR